MGEQLLILLVVITGAAVMPFFAKMLRIPSAALEILYGMLVFNLVIHERPEWFYLMKELGLIYLMFIAGMELRIGSVLKSGRFCWYLLIPFLSFLSMPVIFYRLGYSFYMGLAISMISAGIVVPVLKENAMTKTDLGKDIIGVALAGELLSILVLTAINIYHNHGISVMAAYQGAKLLFFMILSAIFIRVLYIMAWWNPGKVQRVMESEDPVEEGIRGVILILFAGAGLTYLAGVEPILGSFISGVIFSHVFKSTGKFEDKINAVGFGFFTPFFFIGVGAGFDLSLFGSFDSIRFSMILVVMIHLSNIFPVFLAPLMKIRVAEGLAMSFILSAPLSLLVVAGTIGTRINLIDPGIRDALVLAALISSVLYPFLFRQMGRIIMLGGEEEQRTEGVRGVGRLN